MADEIALLREQAERWLAQPLSESEWPGNVRAQLVKLRRHRQFDLMLRMAEAAARWFPNEPELRRLQAQALIEAGQLTAARDVLASARRVCPPGHAEAPELAGLEGRALKQLHVEVGRTGSPLAGDYLLRAIEAYEVPWSTAERPYWHGVNALALRRRARLLGVMVGDEGVERELAREVQRRAPEVDGNGDPDHFGLATRFEAALSLDLDDARTKLHDLVASAPPPFNVGSLLRQLEQIWSVPGHDAALEPFISALRAHHAVLPAAEVPPITARELAAYENMPTFDRQQLEAIFGPDGPNTMKWWIDGLAAAKSVCAVIGPDGRRIGTGFAVRAKQLCGAWEEAVVILTNFHVCNRDGVLPGLHIEDVVIQFTAIENGRLYRVTGVRCESSQGELDYAVLDVDSSPDVPPLDIIPRLPIMPKPPDPQPRVFVIGHPDGRGLEFSIQNSYLVDIEGVVKGTPRRRLRYTTPTEKGSSGSPVFRSDKWAVIALHHAGGELRLLNGSPGTHRANEGIAMVSIQQDIAERMSIGESPGTGRV